MRVSERRTVAGLSEVVGARWFRTAMVLTGVVGVGVALGGVGCSSADCSFDATCLDATDAGSDSGSVVWPAGCTPGAEPKDDVECLSDSIGTFVSSLGSDEDGVGDGSRAKPFRTVRKALGLYSKQRHRIHICEGDYRGNLVFEARHSGLEIYGGFSCDPTWRYTGVLSKLRAEDTNVPAAQWKGLTTSKVRDVEFSAEAATKDGGSSIAVFVSNSTVDIARARLSAGDGKKGANGVLVPFTFRSATDLQGKSGGPLAGGPPTPIQCQGDLKTEGAKGGDRDGNGGEGSPSTSGSGTAGTNQACLAGTPGGTGGKGADGTAGNNGATADKYGELTSDGWQPRAGGNGEDGRPGQGGGGGGGGSTGAGGGGGAGGCGGTGGPGGQPGGSSIALASFASTVNMVDTILIAANGANAGNGIKGQVGQTPGGNRGVADANGNGCNGGSGGAGGAGGTGSGGAGGISVGVLWSGREPTLDASTRNRIDLGNAGSGGTGEPPTQPGVNGVAQAVLAL